MLYEKSCNVNMVCFRKYILTEAKDVEFTAPRTALE